MSLIDWALFAFIIGLVTVGTMMPYAQAQPDIYQRATLESITSHFDITLDYSYGSPQVKHMLILL